MILKIIRKIKKISINFIFNHLHKNFSLIYSVCPNINKINKIFAKYNLFNLDKMQMDFVIIKNKLLINFDDLSQLKEKTDENIDIIGEIGINIFNEEDKCYQLKKKSKINS